MFIGEESYNSSTSATTVALPYTVSVEVVTGSPDSGYTDRIWNGKGSSTDNTEQKNCDAVNGIVEIKGTYTSAITPAYLLVAFTSGAKNDQGNGHLKTIDIIVDGTTYFSIDLGTTNGIAAALMANHPTNATNHSLFAIKLPSKINVLPKLNFDTYNKLTLSGLDSDATSNVTFNGNTYSIGTATDIYIENAGTYEAESKSASTFALVSNVVSGTISARTFPETSHRFKLENGTITDDNDSSQTFSSGGSFDAGVLRNDSKTSLKVTRNK